MAGGDVQLDGHSCIDQHLVGAAQGIDFDVSDFESDPVTLTWEYSVDGGPFLAMTPAAGSSNPAVGVELEAGRAALLKKQGVRRAIRADAFQLSWVPGEDEVDLLWLNPPYSRDLISKFAEKLVDSDFSQAIVLVNNATETEWFQLLSRVSSAVCFHSGRIRFLVGSHVQQQASVR